MPIFCFLTLDFLRFLAYKQQTFSQNLMLFNNFWGLLGYFAQLAILKVNILRREVWTVKGYRNLSYTLQHYINFILRIYIEASVRRF